MTVTLNFFHNSSDTNVLNKNLINGATISAVLKEDTSEEEPVFILSNANYNDYYNYLYCEELERYYFVAPPVHLQAGRVQLQCSVDVLETYKDDILNLRATVARNETYKNGYLMDGGYNSLAYEKVVTLPFPNGFQQDSVILMTMG